MKPKSTHEKILAWQNRTSTSKDYIDHSRHMDGYNKRLEFQ